MIEIGAALVLAFCLGSAFGRWLQARVVQAQTGQITALDGRLREVSHDNQRMRDHLLKARVARWKACARSISRSPVKQAS